MIDSKRWKGHVWIDGAGHPRRGGHNIQSGLDTLWWETAQTADAFTDMPFACTVPPMILLHRGSTLPEGV